MKTIKSCYWIVSLCFLTAVCHAQEDEISKDVLDKASAVCLVEITEIERYGGEACGSPYVNYHFRVLEGTGKEVGQQGGVYFQAGTDGGGFHPGGVPKWYEPSVLKINSLDVGERHWLVHGSDFDPEKYPQGIVYWFPDGDDVPEELKAAVKADSFSWHPIFEKQTGLTYGWNYDEESNETVWRVTREGMTIWQRSFPGTRVAHVHGNELVRIQQIGDRKASTSIGFTQISDLGKENDFGIRKGRYRFVYQTDLATGKLDHIYICGERHGSEIFTRTFEQATERVISETRETFMRTGGRDFDGSTTDHWRRLDVKEFDPETGSVTAEWTARWGTAPGQPSAQWIRLNQ